MEAVFAMRKTTYGRRRCRCSVSRTTAAATSARSFDDEWMMEQGYLKPNGEPAFLQCKALTADVPRLQKDVWASHQANASILV